MSIDDWRRRIDEIDLKLLALLNERANCALEIGHEKHLKGLPRLSAGARERNFGKCGARESWAAA